MKLEELNILGDKEIKLSIAGYKRLGFEVDVVEYDNENIKVIIHQKRLINGYILNQKELVERAKEIFEPCGLKVKVIPSVFSLDVSFITLEWIESKMKEFGIKRNDLIKQLAIDKATLSLYLNGERKLNKSVKAAFYYYFLTYELNKGLRGYLNND